MFEGARGFLGRLAVARPFGTVEGLFDTARRIAHAMPAEEQIELIDAHPRLGASPGSVSALSFVEQGYDREGTERAPETAGTERAPATPQIQPKKIMAMKTATGLSKSRRLTMTGTIR